MPSALDGLRGLPIPRQQRIESIDRVSIDHALEHVAQVGVGLDAVHLARFDQRAECRPSGSADIRAGEEMILSCMRIFAYKKLCKVADYAQSSARLSIDRPFRRQRTAHNIRGSEGIASADPKLGTARGWLR